MLKRLCDVGKAALAYQQEPFRNHTCKRIQCDELWSYVGAKQCHVPEEGRGTGEQGEVWTWVAIDAAARLVIAGLLGGRDATSAKAFMHPGVARLAYRVQHAVEQGGGRTGRRWRVRCFYSDVFLPGP